MVICGAVLETYAILFLNLETFCFVCTIFVFAFLLFLFVWRLQAAMYENILFSVIKRGRERER